MGGRVRVEERVWVVNAVRVDFTVAEEDML